jgi:MinD-like ATPase involved in chromosome partitioning or flagellar assembly/WD40 repeat protein
MKNVAATAPPGRVITFYSYKGGTGRSMALANVAWLLAFTGKRILVIDWDLEAPGIHRYFHPFLEDKELAATEGLLDFLEKVAGRSAVTAEPLAPSDVDVLDYVTVLSTPPRSGFAWERFGPRGRIDLLTAGRQDAQYSRRLNTFNLVDFYERLNGRTLLAHARTQFCAAYDYVLIDSRTGVSDTSGICTVEMPDALVVCFTLNDQSINGASGVAQSVLTQRKALEKDEADGFRIYPVPMRVEMQSEKVKREIALALAAEKFGPFLDHLDENQRRAYWGNIQIPYIPFYAFEEIPAAFADAPSDQLGLLGRMKALAATVTETPSIDVPLLANDFSESERLRTTLLNRFLRGGGEVAPDLVLVASNLYEQAAPAERQLMRDVLLRALYVTPGSRPSPAPLLLNRLDAPRRKIADSLAQAGVMQASGNAVLMLNPAVFAGWQPLQTWARDEESFLVWRQDVSRNALRWLESGRDPYGLLRGAWLNQALGWREMKEANLTPLEDEFILVSRQPPVGITGADAEQAKQAWRARALYIGLVAVAIVLVAWKYDTIQSVLARFTRTDNLTRAAEIISQAQTYLEKDPLKAALLLLEIGPHTASESERQVALQVAGTLLPSTVVDIKQAARDIDFSPDGQTAVLATENGVELRTMPGLKLIQTLQHSVGAISAAFNGWRGQSSGQQGRASRVVAVDAQGLVKVWTADGQSIMTFQGADPSARSLASCANRRALRKGPLRTIPQGNPFEARFSPDERVLLLSYPGNTILMIDAQTGACFDVFSVPDSGAARAAISADGEWVAALAGTELTAFHVQDWQQQKVNLGSTGLGSRLSLMAMSSQQAVAIAGTFDAQVWNVSGAEPSGETFFSGVPAQRATFSADGGYVVVINGEAAEVAAVGSQQVPEKLRSPLAVGAAAFQPQTSHLVTSSSDGSIRVWPLTMQAPAPRSTWDELMANIRQRTRACLLPEERIAFLKEDASTAHSGYRQCEGGSTASAQ